MTFAKLASEVKMTAAAAPINALEQLNTLAFNRRDLAQWNQEFRNKVGAFEPKLIDLFDPAPRIQLENCHDDQAIINLREHFTKKIAAKESYRGTVRKNGKFF